MSGTNANILMGFRPTPNIGPDFGGMVANSQQLLQLRQQQQQVEQQNALIGVFQNPDAVDKTTGLPTGDTLQKVTAINPQVGLQMRQNLLAQQDQQMKRDAMMGDEAAKNADRIAEALSPVVENYQTNIKNHMTPEQANQIAAGEYKVAIDQLGARGFDPNRLKQAPQGWDPVKVPLLVESTKGFRDWQKEQLAAKHQDDLAKRYAQMGQQTMQLASGETVVFHPGEDDPKKQYTYANTGEPVPAEKLGGLAKAPTGGGTPAAADLRADRDITTEQWKKDHGGNAPDMNDPVQKAAFEEAVQKRAASRKADTAAGAAAARQAATAKPIPVTVDGKPLDAVWKNGQWYQADGTTPLAGDIRLAPRPASAGSAAAEKAARFDEIKAAQQAAGTYKDDTSVYRAVDKQMAEDKQTVISDDAALIAAQVALKTGHPPAWMGRSQASLSKFLDAYAAEAKRQHLTADDIAANIARFSGEMAEARTLGTSSARIDFAAKELDVALPTAMAASERVWRPGFKAVAEIQQAIKGQASDPDLLEFAQFNQQVMSAYAAAMNRGGVSTVHSMERAEGLLSTATSQAGYMRQLDTLHKEVQTILYGTQAAKDHLRAEITNSPEVTTPPVLTGIPRPAAAGAVKIPTSLADADKAGQLAHNADGTVFYNTQTKKYFDKNGKETAAPGAAAETPQPEAKPLPMPKSAADAVDGQTYDTARGPAKWNAKTQQFIPVGSK